MREERTDASDVLAVYTTEVARYPLLSREKEREVGLRALEGDNEAVHELVRANLRFVIRLAKKYEGRGVPLMDLINAGNIGLIHAARKYDPSLGFKLISYATRWITQQMQKEIDVSKGDVRETPTQFVRIRRIRRLNAEAKQRIGREYTIEELMDLTEFTEAMIREALDYRVTLKSFDDPVSPNDESTTTLAQVIGAEDNREELEAEAELQQRVRQMLQTVLSPRETKIVEDYYGFGGRREMSLTEIGDAEGVTRERARQIKERALKKIREARDFHPMLKRLFITMEVMEERRSRMEEEEEEQKSIPEAVPFSGTSELLNKERELYRQRRLERLAEEQVRLEEEERVRAKAAAERRAAELAQLEAEMELAGEENEEGTLVGSGPANGSENNEERWKNK